MFVVDMIIRNLLSSLVPTEPLNLRAFNLTSQRLNVSWSEPKRRNGILTNYIVYYKLLRNDKNQNVPGTTWNTETIYSSKLTVELKNLGKFFNLLFKGHWQRNFLLSVSIRLTHGILNFIFSSFDSI